MSVTRALALAHVVTARLAVVGRLVSRLGGRRPARKKVPRVSTVRSALRRARVPSGRASLVSALGLPSLGLLTLASLALAQPAIAQPALAQPALAQPAGCAKAACADPLTKQLAVDAVAPASTPMVGEVYPLDQSISPITARVAERLRAIAARNGSLHDDRFAKLGASATVNRNYLRCLAGEHVTLDHYGWLGPALAHFNGASENPFRRTSLSATEGWHAGRAIWGSPSPLAEEIRDFDPRFAVVMYGTNDLELNRPALYGRLILRLTEMLIVRGVVPILSTIMPRDDDPESDRYVTLYNAVLRSIAQLQSVPLIDYHRELLPLPGHGLSSDGVHPNVHREGDRPRGCDFTDEGMAHGYNVRNLLTLRALDRAWRALEDRLEPQRPAPRPPGAGSFADPIEVTLPFSTAGDTARAASRARDAYPGCGPQDEGGPEVVYRLRLDEPARVYALATSTHGTDVDLHLLEASGEHRCLRRGDESIHAELEAGEHLLVVDTFVHGGDPPRVGRYALSVARTDLPSDRSLRDEAEGGPVRAE